MKGRLVLLAAAAVLAAIPVVPAAGHSSFAVSPASLDFSQPPVLRGQEYSGLFKLANRGESPVTVTVGTEGDAAGWLTTSPTGPFVMPGRSVKDLVVTVRVPNEAPNGDHAAKLRIRAAGPNVTEAGSGSSVAVEVVPSIKLRVSGDQVVALAFEGVAVRNASAGRALDLTARIANNGNVQAAPKLLVEAFDSAGGKVFDEALQVPAMAPRSGGELSLRTTSTVPSAGDHELRARLVHEDRGFGERVAAFRVHPPGAAGDRPLPEGRIVAFGTDGSPAVGRALRIEAQFANTGTAPIEGARLTGEIFRTGERIAAFQSDPLRIAAGKQEALLAYWTPDQPGEYTLKGFVVFDGLKANAPDRSVGVAASPGTAGQKDEAPSQEEGPEREPFRIPGPAVAAALAGIGLAAAALRRR